MQQERLEAFEDLLAGRHVTFLDTPARGPLSQIRAIRRQGLLGYDGVRFFDSCGPSKTGFEYSAFARGRGIRRGLSPRPLHSPPGERLGGKASADFLPSHHITCRPLGECPSFALIRGHFATNCQIAYLLREGMRRMMLPLNSHFSFQFLTFAAIGAVGTAVHYIILIMLVSGVGLTPVLATSVGAFLGALTNYLLNYRYTFRSSQKHAVAFSKFITVALVGFGVNAFIVEIGVTYARWHYLIAQVLATIAVLFWGFTANKVWTFKGENYARE